jgi:hypothetical protein
MTISGFLTRAILSLGLTATVPLTAHQAGA